MNLITRCPACSTMFKVVPDQLRVSDGWVRCGQCDEVFDANAHLHSGESAIETDALASEVTDADHETHTSAEPLSTFSAEASPSAEEDRPSLPISGQDAFLEKSPHELSRLDGVLESVSLGNHYPERMAEAELADATEAALASIAPRYMQSDSALRIDDSALHLSFMRSSHSSSAWHRPAARATLSLIIFILAVVLFLQIAQHNRDKIAAFEPDARPFLYSMCHVLACRIVPLRQIESIVIDSSAFTKVRADVYRLSFTLRNTAPIEVAMPALELTLTDLQDQSMVRRVLQTADFGGKSEALPAGAEINLALHVNIKVAGSTERVSGYRLIAFYP